MLAFVIVRSTASDDLVAAPTTTAGLAETSTSGAERSTSTIRSFSTTSTGPASTTTPDPLPAILAVPGATGTLHALVGDSNRQVIDVPTEADASPRGLDSVPLGFVTDFALDVSNEFVAFLRMGEDPTDPYQLNVWSERSHFSLADVGVDSYQWHQSQPRLLAAITIADPRGPAELQTLAFNDSGRVSDRATITDLGADHSLRGWGEWGFLVGHYDQLLETEVTTLLDETGEVVWQAEDMNVLDSSPDQILVLQSSDEGQDTHSVIDPTNPDAMTVLPLPDGATISGSDWSPDHRLAVHYPSEGRNGNIRIYDPELTKPTDITLEGWRVWDLNWGPNNRFIVIPGTDDAGRHVVIFYDTTTQTLSFVDFHDWVQWADLS